MSERLRATAAVRTSPTNGFTAIRDLETEGGMYADVDVKTSSAVTPAGSIARIFFNRASVDYVAIRTSNRADAIPVE